MSQNSYPQEVWDGVLNFFGNDDFNVRVIGTFLVTFGVYWALGSLFTFVDVTGRPKFMLKYKVQDNFNSYPISGAQFKDLLFVIFMNQIFTFPLAMLSFYIEQYRGVRYPRELPSLSTCVFQFAIFISLREVTFYYSHRLLHHPSIYKNIHKKHHTWVAPVAIAAAYCHPFEHIFSNVIPIIIGPQILRAHTALYWIWTSYCTIETLCVHSGFHLPLLASPEFHDFHHLKFNYNYGINGFMDRFHHTDSLFRKSKQFFRHKTLWTTTPVKASIPD